MHRFSLSLSRLTAPRPLGFAPLLCCAAALLLCLLAPARPASAQTVISTDTTISTLINDAVRVTGDATVDLVPGGTIQFYLSAYDTSIINVSGGTIAGYLSATDASTVNVSGGTVASPGLLNNSTLNLAGGTIVGDFVLFGPNTRLNVFGSNLSLSDPQIGQFGFSSILLSGTLADGTPINRRVRLLNAQFNQITLIEVYSFAALREQVAALGAAGVLNKGNTNALTVKLDAAQAALQSGDTAGAQDSLTAFINQVKAFVRTGKLTQAQGQPLLQGAQAILDDIG